MYHIKPLSGKVIVKRSPFKDKSEGGIYLPETAKDPRSADLAVEAVVLRSNAIETKFLEGETVLIGRFAGQVIDSKEWILMLGENEILAKIGG